MLSHVDIFTLASPIEAYQSWFRATRSSGRRLELSSGVVRHELSTFNGKYMDAVKGYLKRGGPTTRSKAPSGPTKSSRDGSTSSRRWRPIRPRSLASSIGLPTRAAGVAPRAARFGWDDPNCS